MSTTPTAKGKEEIDAFHPLYGLHYLDRKAMTEFLSTHGSDRTQWLQIEKGKVLIQQQQGLSFSLRLLCASVMIRYMFRFSLFVLMDVFNIAASFIAEHIAKIPQKSKNTANHLHSFLHLTRKTVQITQWFIYLVCDCTPF